MLGLGPFTKRRAVDDSPPPAHHSVITSILLGYKSATADKCACQTRHTTKTKNSLACNSDDAVYYTSTWPGVQRILR